MKKFIALVACLFVFGACGLTEEKTEQNLLNGQEVDHQETSADAVLDDQIFSQATSAGNLEECEKILNQAKKAECKEVVEAISITNGAVEKMDLAECEKIVLARYKEYCISKTSTIIDSFNAEENEKKKVEAMNEISQRAIDNGNVELCDKIEDENKRFSCKYNIITDKALKDKNPQLCNEIGEETLVNFCMKLVEN